MQAKIPSASTTLIFEIPIGTKNFPKPHHVTWYDVVGFSLLDVPILNPVINPGMLKPCYIHPNLGCPLAPKSLEIPSQMGVRINCMKHLMCLTRAQNFQLVMYAGSYELR